MSILHDRSIIVRNERGEFYVGGGKFTDNLADRKILHYSSIMAAHLDARPAKCTVSFWEEGNEGELREVFE